MAEWSKVLPRYSIVMLDEERYCPNGRVVQGLASV